MKLYRTSDNCIINLDNVSAIMPTYDDKKMSILFTCGQLYEMSLSEDDLENIMEYNNYLIK